MAKKQVSTKLECKKCHQVCYKMIEEGRKQVITWCIKCNKDTKHVLSKN